MDAGFGLLLLAINLLVIAPYLGTNLSSQSWNNDYTYLAMTQMFRDLPWTWNGLQYGGAPFTYIYPPLFHALTAALPVSSLGRAYHITSGIGYAAAPVALYVLGVVLFRSRMIAGAAAIAYSFFPSPVYFVLRDWGGLALPFHHAPWPFVALAGYAESPHLFSLSFTLLAVAAAWRDRYKTAALCAAAVFLISWPGLLAVTMALVAVAIAQTRAVGFDGALGRLVATGGTAYGLTAFWMTPGFFAASMMMSRVVLRHEGATRPWTSTNWLILAVAAGMVTVALWRRVPAVAALVIAWTAISGAVVATFSLAGNQLLPLPHRYVLEFNLCLLLGVAGLVSLCGKYRAVVVAVLLAWGTFASRDFVRAAWTLQPERANESQLLAYRMAKWLGGHAGQSRVLVAGELDGSLNYWENVAQVGGIRQGASNLLFMGVQRQVIFGCGDAAHQARLAELWLRALDTRYVAVHDADSREYFHWFVQPREFDGLPVAWDDGAGDKIYGVPLAEQSQAVVVDLEALSKLPPVRSTEDEAAVAAYVRWAEGKRPAGIRWSGMDKADLDATLAPNEGVLVKVNYDRGWRAGHAAVEADPIGMLLIRGGSGRFTLRFGAAPDVWLGRALTLITIALLLFRVSGVLVGLMATIPAAIALLLLVWHVPQTVKTAEDSFIRLHPPIINSGGVVDSLTGKLARRTTKYVSVYGVDFGKPRDLVNVWMGGRRANILYRSTNQLNVEAPPDPAADAQVSVEVNGCRGNSFALWGGDR